MISINPFKLNRCDWFIVLFVLYYLQGILYSAGGMISNSLFIVITVISVKYALDVAYMKNKPVYFKGLNLLLLMLSLYGLLYIFFHPLVVKYPLSGKSYPSYNYLKTIYISLLPIYPFYYFSRRGYLTEATLKKWAIVFLFSVMLTYFRTQQEALHKLMERGSSAEEVTNNSGYLFLSCIPLLVLYRNKPLLQFAGLGFIIMFIVLGMKRGAIIIGVVMSVFIIFEAIENARGRTRNIVFFLSVIICIGATSFFVYQMNHSEYMIKRIQDTMEGNSSGRDNLYSFFWRYFTEKAETLDYLIGRGANGTLEIYYNYAHNDWLEIAINQGMIGIIIYMTYWYCFYKTWKRAENTEARTIIMMVFIIFFARTFISMSYGDMTYVDTCVLGYALAYMNKPNILFRKNWTMKKKRD